MMQDLQSLMPLALALAGNEAAGGIYRAINEVNSWWVNDYI
jgi:hypothetical protein